MLKSKKNESCGSTPCKKRSFVWIAAGTLAMLIVSFFVTQGLPWKPLYEVRYEFRVRNFLKNVDGNERILRNLNLRNSYWLCGFINSLPGKDGLDRKVRYDDTEKITVSVRGADSAAVAAYGMTLYDAACDTLRCYGDSMCAVIARVLKDEIATLPDVLDDSLAALRGNLYEQLGIVTIDSATGAKYIELLNASELPMAHKTPARGWVLLAAALMGMLFMLAVCILKRGRDNEGC